MECQHHHQHQEGTAEATLFESNQKRHLTHKLLVFFYQYSIESMRTYYHVCGSPVVQWQAEKHPRAHHSLNDQQILRGGEYIWFFTKAKPIVRFSPILMFWAAGNATRL